MSVLWPTLLCVWLWAIKASEFFVALDSMPAVLAVTLNAFIVYTSNVFAILGLRSMYFAMAGMLKRFVYLPYGLAIVLMLVGLKMIGSHFPDIPTEWKLEIGLLFFLASVIASIVHSPTPDSKRIQAEVAAL